MNGLLLQIAVSLRLYFRNRMALIYGYLFPTIFLVAFWVLYRYETPPLVRHMGELLTVAILGGACFGLPTTMVSDRERGVWRRYRLTPVPTVGIVTSTVFARYLLLLTAGLLQLVLAMLIGMPAPRHPLDLFIAFTCVSFAFLGLGLVIATMADTVPAVQALGQCIFLPMLIIGGVAVPLESLPDWAQHVSAFFPGRYAVEALRATVMGDGLGATRFSLLALLVIGAAGCVAGARLFRWDSQQRFAAMKGKPWVAVALVAWLAVGAAAEARHRTVLRSATAARAASAPPPASQPPVVAAPPQAPTPTPVPVPVPGPPPSDPDDAPAPPPAAAPAHVARRAAGIRAGAIISTRAPDGCCSGRRGDVRQTPTATPVPPLPPAKPAPPEWQKTTLADIDREIDFTRLPARRGRGHANRARHRGAGHRGRRADRDAAHAPAGLGARQGRGSGSACAQPALCCGGARRGPDAD